MKITYDKVKNDMWEIIKDKTDFVYESSNYCDACTAHSEWMEWGEDVFPDGPPEDCTQHYEQDACRYFYANDKGYSDSSAPACVVGNWFAYEKFSPEDLAVETWEALEGNGIRKLLENSRIDIDPEAVNFLNNMQTFQDTTMSWGNSFERAVTEAEGQSDETE
jgi:hypothetical protein